MFTYSACPFHTTHLPLTRAHTQTQSARGQLFDPHRIERSSCSPHGLLVACGGGNILLQIDGNSLNDALSWGSYQVEMGWEKVQVTGTGSDAEACGMLNALECFRMVDRITRSNSIRNTLCCCFYYLCLFLLLSCCCFLLSEVAFVCGI